MTHIPFVRTWPLALAVAIGALASAGGAQAHAHLVTSTPAANASVAAPSEIDLKFSEAPLAKFSGVDLTMTGGEAVPVKMVGAADKVSMAIAPIAPLKPGRYTVKWHAVTADTHRSEGAFSFTVR